MKEFQDGTVGPWRQVLFPHKMHWHASDHRQLSKAKWLWIEPRGQWEERSTSLLDQSRVNVAGRTLVLSREPSGRLSPPGPSTGHVLLTESHMNYYISFCYLTSWFITDRQSSFKRSTTLSPPHTPSDAPRKERGRRERESESVHSLVKRLEDGQNHIVHGF